MEHLPSDSTEPSIPLEKEVPIVKNEREEFIVEHDILPTDSREDVLLEQEKLAEIDEVLKKTAEMESQAPDLIAADEHEASAQEEHSAPSVKSKKLSKNKPLSRFKKFLQLGFAGLVIQGSAATAPGQTRTLSPDEARTLAQSAELYAQIQKVDRQKIIEATGIDLFEVGRQAGFKVQLQVENGNGEYIIDIGQSHYIPSYEKYPELKQKIIQTQKNVEKALLALVHDTNTKVYTEGIINNNLQELLDNHRTSLQAISYKDDDCFKKVFLLYEKNVLQKKFAPTMGSAAVIHVYQYKADSLMKEISERYAAYPNRVLDAQRKYEDIRRRMFSHFEIGNADGVYIMGANFKLAAEGKIRLAVSETNEGNSAAAPYKKQLNVIDEKIRLLDISIKEAYKRNDITATNSLKRERASLEGQCKEVEKKCDEKVFDGRNEIAVQKIIQDKNQEKIKILVFGTSHTFTKQVENYNRQNPQRKMGLIKFIPIMQAK